MRFGKLVTVFGAGLLSSTSSIGVSVFLWDYWWYYAYNFLMVCEVYQLSGLPWGLLLSVHIFTLESKEVHLGSPSPISRPVPPTHYKVPFQEAVIEDLLDPDFSVRGFRWEKKLEKKNGVISIFQWEAAFYFCRPDNCPFSYELIFEWSCQHSLWNQTGSPISQHYDFGQVIFLSLSCGFSHLRQNWVSSRLTCIVDM